MTRDDSLIWGEKFRNADSWSDAYCCNNPDCEYDGQTVEKGVSGEVRVLIFLLVAIGYYGNVWAVI